MPTVVATKIYETEEKKKSVGWGGGGGRGGGTSGGSSNWISRYSNEGYLYAVRFFSVVGLMRRAEGSSAQARRNPLTPHLRCLECVRDVATCAKGACRL